MPGQFRLCRTIARLHGGWGGKRPPPPCVRRVSVIACISCALSLVGVDPVGLCPFCPFCPTSRNPATALSIAGVGLVKGGDQNDAVGGAASVKRGLRASRTPQARAARHGVSASALGR